MSVNAPDKWQHALKQKKEELKQCQEREGLQSCLPCGKLLQCLLRDAYIKAVYDKMNKGSGGGFEF